MERLKEFKKVGKRYDLKGETIYHWQVLGPAPKRGNLTYWLCRCECGKEREVQTSFLTRGKSKSCGCMSKKYAKESFVVRGNTGLTLEVYEEAFTTQEVIKVAGEAKQKGMTYGEYVAKRYLDELARE